MTAQTSASTGLTARILAYLAAFPEQEFRPAEVARALLPEEGKSASTLQVGTCMTKLARKGRLARVSRDVPASSKPGSTKTVTLYRLSR